MHYLSLLLVFPTLLILGVGCGPDCQSTCSKIYQSPCGIERPGASQTELVQECMGYCEDALSKPGEAGNYDPNQKLPPSEKPTLETDQQVALWMECVEQTSCQNLEKNYCAPIW